MQQAAVSAEDYINTEIGNFLSLWGNATVFRMAQHQKLIV